MEGAFEWENAFFSADEITAEKNEENGWIPEENDDEQDRHWLQVMSCPFHSQSSPCSKGSWDKNTCWSYVSTQQTMKYLMWHGTQQIHRLSEEEAYSILNDSLMSKNIQFELKTETYKMRQQYRKMVARQQAASWANAQPKANENFKKRKREEPVKKELEEKSEAGSVDVDMGNLDGVNPAQVAKIVEAAAKATSQAVVSALTSASSSSFDQRTNTIASLVDSIPGASGLGIDLPLVPVQQAGNIVISRQTLLLIQESLERAESSMRNLLIQALGISKDVQKERLVVQNAVRIVSGITGQKPKDPQAFEMTA